MNNSNIGNQRSDASTSFKSDWVFVLYYIVLYSPVIQCVVLAAVTLFEKSKGNGHILHVWIEPKNVILKIY